MISAKYNYEATKCQSVILVLVEPDSERQHFLKQVTKLGEMTQCAGGNAHVRSNE